MLSLHVPELGTHGGFRKGLLRPGLRRVCHQVKARFLPWPPRPCTLPLCPHFSSHILPLAPSRYSAPMMASSLFQQPPPRKLSHHLGAFPDHHPPVVSPLTPNIPSPLPALSSPLGLCFFWPTSLSYLQDCLLTRQEALEGRSVCLVHECIPDPGTVLNKDLLNVVGPDR